MKNNNPIGNLTETNFYMFASFDIAKLDACFGTYIYLLSPVRTTVLINFI